MPAHAQTRYAIGLEKESMKGIEATFGPKAQEQWSRSLAEWIEFGNHIFETFNQVMDRRQARPPDRQAPRRRTL